jgi:hypothetical protein
MFDRSRRTLAATAAAFFAALGLGGVAIASSGNGSQPANPPAHTSSAAVKSSETPGVESTAPENSATDPDNVQYTGPNDPDAKKAGATKTVAASSSTPEAPGTEQSPATEQSGGAEQPGSEVPGDDGPGGHADEPGNPNADHQFQGKQ